MSHQIAIRAVALLYALPAVYFFLGPIFSNTRPFFVWLTEELFSGVVMWFIMWGVLLFVAYRFWNMSSQDYSLLIRQKIALAFGTINLVVLAFLFLGDKRGIEVLEDLPWVVLCMILTLVVAALLLKK